MLSLIHIKEALRIFRRHLAVKRNGFRQYKGNVRQILKQCVDSSYSIKKGFFQVSNGHFSEFYTRDFGWCTASLLKLGYKKQVISTLRYALSIFKKYNKVTVAISPDGRPFDFPCYAVDSLPYLIHSLTLANTPLLVNEYKSFLNSQISLFFTQVIDKKTGIVRKDKYFSSMKDHSVRYSSCYDNCMVAMLKDDISKLNLNNPLNQYNYKKLIMDNFWTGSYFLDDLSGAKYVSGDSNIFPFLTGTIKDKSIMKKAFRAMEEHKLTEPFPLKYTAKKTRLNFMRFLLPNYELDSIWMHMGPLYLMLLKSIDEKKFQHYLNKYLNQVAKYKNFFELYHPDGTPYHAWCYSADESMLWAANVLVLL